MEELASMGAAGVMGAMWLWERRNSQKREHQLDETHTRVMADRLQLEQLIEVVRANSDALSRMSASWDQVLHQLSAPPTGTSNRRKGTAP